MQQQKRGLFWLTFHAWSKVPDTTNGRRVMLILSCRRLRCAGCVDFVLKVPELGQARLDVAHPGFLSAGGFGCPTCAHAMFHLEEPRRSRSPGDLLCARRRGRRRRHQRLHKRKHRDTQQEALPLLGVHGSTGLEVRSRSNHSRLSVNTVALRRFWRGWWR